MELQSEGFRGRVCQIKPDIENFKSLVGKSGKYLNKKKKKKLMFSSQGIEFLS